jgi:hypothetical protein
MEAIKVNELRVCNLVNDPALENPIEIQPQGLVYVQSGQFKVYPIPLTEEWLLKFGFENLGINDPYDAQYVLHNVIDGTSDFTINVCGDDFEPTIDGTDAICWHDFNYVHQLQNLFFILIGKELTLKNGISHFTLDPKDIS